MKRCFKNILSVLIVSMLFASCNVWDGPGGNESGDTVSLTLLLDSRNYNIPADNATRAVMPDESFTGFKVFVFANTPQQEYLYSVTPVQKPDNRYVISLKKTEASKSINLVLVANADSNLPSTIVSYDDLVSKVSQVDLPTGITKLPLWGIKKNVVVTSSLSSLHVELIRPISKFQVILAPELDVRTLVINGVYLANATSKVNIPFRLNTKGELDLLDPSTEKFKNPSYIAIDGNSNGRATIEYPLAETKSGVEQAAFVIIEGTYRGSTKSSFYRLQLKDVVRNVNYKYYISKVTDAGYSSFEQALNSSDNLDAKVLSWEAGIKYTYYSKGFYFGVSDNYYDLKNNIEEVVKYQTNLNISDVKMVYSGNQFVSARVNESTKTIKISRIGRPSGVNFETIPFLYTYTDGSEKITLVHGLVHVGKKTFMD